METNTSIPRLRHSIPLWILLLASSVLAEPSLLTTITNPAPASGDNFGFAMAAVGSDRLLVGAPYVDTDTATDAGAAYLFGTNGTLLMTYTNPSPENYEHFGASVAVIGSDGMLIGTHKDNNAGSSAGAAYLFSTNGMLLTTLKNPFPTALDQFGTAVAAVGTDRAIIGASGVRGGVGVAYLFDTTTAPYGTLLTTLANPVPGPFLYDYFGSSVAAVGSDRVLVGAYQDESGGGGRGLGRGASVRYHYGLRWYSGDHYYQSRPGFPGLFRMVGGGVRWRSGAHWGI